MLAPLNISPRSKYNAYPAVFSAMQEIYELSNPFFYGKVRIMSFGCGDGAEVRALQDKYFKHCSILGCDINSKLINLADEHEKGIAKYLLINNITSAHNDFDIIFAIDVFGAEKDEQPIKFEDADIAYQFLYDCLTMGGFLVITNPNYKLLDSCVGRHFRPVKDKISPPYKNEILQYNSKGKINNTDNYVIFKKVD